jgi:hypothetical protein
MGELVYILCAVMSLVCAVLLLRAWRANRTKLLLWSTICFGGLFLNNMLLVVDVVVAKDAVDLLIVRDVTNLASVTALLIGLVWNTR